MICAEILLFWTKKMKSDSSVSILQTRCPVFSVLRWTVTDSLLLPHHSDMLGMALWAAGGSCMM